MANPEHLAVLNSGLDAWNRWRQEHPDLRPDLSCASLRHANLQGMNFQNATLSGADCTGANFADADLVNADLSNAQLQDAILKWADSRGAIFDGATFTQNPAMSLHLVTSLLARGAIAYPPQSSCADQDGR